MPTDDSGALTYETFKKWVQGTIRRAWDEQPRQPLLIVHPDDLPWWKKQLEKGKK